MTGFSQHRRIAGIDCGTNSIRLLIADAAPDGANAPLIDVVREMRIVRLGQGVDHTGRLDPEAIERTRIALAEYAGLIQQHGAQSVRMVATSATRDASNRDDFFAMVSSTLGRPAEVISGVEEAGLSFIGAVGTLPGLDQPTLVADIGGGSTELVVGSGSVSGSYSMDVGCVRLTERHLHADPPLREQIDATVHDVEAALAIAGQSVDWSQASTFVGVAGTVTTVVAIANGLNTYDSDRIHGMSATFDQVADVTEMLVGATRKKRASIGVMHPGRVDVIAGGALVLRTIMSVCGQDLVVASEHDILDGIVLSQLT